MVKGKKDNPARQGDRKLDLPGDGAQFAAPPYSKKRHKTIKRDGLPAQQHAARTRQNRSADDKVTLMTGL
jgi:hypothetical protein